MKRVDFDYFERHFPHRPADAHKGTMGTLVSLTGSFGFAGAAVLSAKAALRSGVGLHYQIIPESVYPLFGTSVHESVCIPVKGHDGRLCHDDIDRHVWSILDKASAILIGCGMGCTDDTAVVLDKILTYAKCPVIVDADGINILAKHIYSNTDAYQKQIILTPHIKELSRLTGRSVPEILSDPAKHAEEYTLAVRDVTLVLKGHRTYIAQNGEVIENIAGNSGMAKGGSGDVLAGVIASLTAQGVQSYHAAVMGVHIHALAGDIAAAKLSQTAMLPSDIIEALPEIYTKIEDAIQ